MGPLVLRLSPLAGSRFRVIVERSPAGDPEADSTLPFDGGRRHTLLKALEATHFRPGDFPDADEQEWMVEAGLLTSDRQAFAPDMRAVIGRAVYQALFPVASPVEAVLNDSLAITESRRAPLHVQLKIGVDTTQRALVADYPWELAHNGRAFLATQGVTFSRYIAYDAVPPNLPPMRHLNVLLVSSTAFDSKWGLDPLSKQEQQAIRNGLARAEQAGTVRLLEPEFATLAALRAYLTEHRGDVAPHVIHFDGHGLFGKRCNASLPNQVPCRTMHPSVRNTRCACCNVPLPALQGYLLFENQTGGPDYVSAEELGALLRQVALSEESGRPGVTLLILSACQSALSLAGEAVFNGVAQSLIGHGVPAVVAMQNSISVVSATAFAEQFYRVLGQREPLVLAVSNACEAIGFETNQWYRPVLYLRWQDNDGGQLFAAESQATKQLAEAQRQLALLPLDTIPPIASALPPGSRLDLRPNRLFVGRDHDLKSLAALCKTDTGATGRPIIAVTGLGGLGKTQLAVEFAHRYGPYFAGGVFWLSFANPADVPAQVAACASEELLLRPGFRDLSVKEQVRLVQADWQSELPRLLVFDNCEDPVLLDGWTPASGGGRILLTSRRANWDAHLGVQVVQLGVLDRSESVSLLRQHRTDLAADDPDLAEIADELGDLPLAVDLAGRYLADNQYDVTPGEYLAKLRGPGILVHPSLQAEGLSPTRHGQHVVKTFRLSTEALDPANPRDRLAQQLLTRAAGLAPGQPIPRHLLRATVQQLILAQPEDVTEVRPDNEAVSEALRRLTDLGLLKTEAAGALRLHRLLAVFVRAEIPDPDAQSAVENAVLEAVQSLHAGADPRPLLPLQPHLRTVTDAALARDDTRAALLCAWLGALLRAQGDYAGARPYLERALAIWERVLGPDHPSTRVMRGNLESLG